LPLLALLALLPYTSGPSHHYITAALVCGTFGLCLTLHPSDGCCYRSACTEFTRCLLTYVHILHDQVCKPCAHTFGIDMLTACRHSQNLHASCRIKSGLQQYRHVVCQYVLPTRHANLSWVTQGSLCRAVTPTPSCLKPLRSQEPLWLISAQVSQCIGCCVTAVIVFYVLYASACMRK